MVNMAEVDNKSTRLRKPDFPVKADELCAFVFARFGVVLELFTTRRKRRRK